MTEDSRTTVIRSLISSLLDLDTFLKQLLQILWNNGNLYTRNVRYITYRVKAVLKWVN